MSFPSVTAGLWGLQEASQFRRVVKKAVDFEVVEEIGGSAFGFGGFGEGSYDSGIFAGVLEPLPERSLAIKPEGQRSWKWLRLWTTMALALDDVIVDKGGTRFRVMSDSDWSGGGYREYQLTGTFDQTENNG